MLCEPIRIDGSAAETDLAPAAVVEDSLPAPQRAERPEQTLFYALCRERLNSRSSRLAAMPAAG